VILQCLIHSKPKTFEEGSMIQALGQEVVKAEKELKLRDELMNFLIETIKSQIYIEDITPNGMPYSRGTFAGWLLAQVATELGVKTDESN
jgi:hypothetical protein